ncbi:hypothetical protein PR048_018239 [Dryococelus australis]|uniref:DUF5641 domain-containing protein n=1 Tax=Dryococelus australis TaxID=614101 RepID=A0ABQ9HCF0_9NEOP|nr:hypothetical protein PR048_018239 [Dryococelus australis]
MEEHFVVIKDDNFLPFKWYLGIICSLHLGKDSVVRVVSVCISQGNLNQSLVKLRVLPLQGIPKLHIINMDLRKGGFIPFGGQYVRGI